LLGFCVLLSPGLQATFMSVECPYGFTLSFQNDQGQPLTVVESKSEHYLVAQEGQAFQVVVTAPPTALPSGQYWLVKLYVDGAHVRSPVMLPSEKRLVDGWAVGDSQVRPMIFSKPPLVENRSAANPEAGKFKIMVSRAKYSKPARSCTCGKCGAAPSSSSAFAGDKFWKQGGLATQAGSVRNSIKHQFWQTTPIPDVPEQTVVVSYSTPMYLMLRNILQQDNPEHAAFFPQEEKEDEDEEKELIDLDEIEEREARRKRQRENEKWEVACDLTTDEPTWSKKPRERPPLEAVDLEELADSDGEERTEQQAPEEEKEEEEEEEPVVKPEPRARRRRSARRR